MNARSDRSGQIFPQISLLYTFSIKRNCFLGKITSLLPDFGQLSPDQNLLTILCPANAEIALCVSKYLKIISETRMKLDLGLSNDMLTNYCKI